MAWPGASAKVEMQGYEAAAAPAPARLGPADPQSSQGKALYVGNLHSSVSQEMLQVWGAVAHYCLPHHMPACALTPKCASITISNEAGASMPVCSGMPCWPLIS